MNVLRDYQQEMLERLHRAWSGVANPRQQACRSVMVQMPTGTGKTYLMAEVIRQRIDRIPRREDGSVLVVAHRIELIEQISRTLDRFGIRHGVLNRGFSLNDGSDGSDGFLSSESSRVMVASIQTLTRRIRPTDRTDSAGDGLHADFSLIIIDEAHHAVAETYRKLWERWPEAEFLGLTATPCRLNGAPFTDLFDTLLQSWSIREFIRKGWLSDLDYVSVRSDSIAVQKVAGLDKRGADGDYQTKQAALVLDTEESIEHLYRSYKEFADGKKGIVYAISREHARHIAEYYSARGLRCAVIDSKTPATERQRIVEEYKASPLTPLLKARGTLRERGVVTSSAEKTSGKAIDILVNVDIFSEGFDVPEVEFIQLARPTLSISKYLQQVGRGMRVAEGKNEVIVLDQVGLYLMFSLPTSDRNWQSTFLGRISGKGKGLNNSREPIANNRLRGNGEEKWLVNEQMFRIKSVVGGKDYDDNLRSSAYYENRETQYALVAKDCNPPAMEFCEETAENLKATLRTNWKVLVQIPPFVEKARFVISLMCTELVWNEERLCMELPKTLVVVRHDYQTDLVELEFKKNGMQDIGRMNLYDKWTKHRSLVVCHEAQLSDRLIDTALSYTPSLVVVWDANSAEPSAYPNALHVWPKAKVVGLSLAPCDIRSIPRFRFFDMVVPSQSLKSSVDRGLLKDVEYVSVPHAGLTGVYLDMLSPKDHPDDYVSGELYRRLVSLESTASLFKAYQEYAGNKRGVVYAFNDTHAQAIAEYFSRHGVPAKVFYGDLPSKPKFSMEEFCKGTLKVLVDIHGMSTSYPLPEMQFVQLAYPTQLLSEYLNMVEARMRVTTDFTESERVRGSDNKLLVIDHVKMKETFGLPTDERDWQRLFVERRIETEREPAKPKNKPRRNRIAGGNAAAAAKWQQRKERLLHVSPVHSDHSDETVKV